MGRNVFDYHNEKMRSDLEYKAAYDALESEFSIADALIRARVEAGLTQAEVAVRLGVTQPAVARMESGRNISLKSVARYAGAIGRPITLEVIPKPLQRLHELEGAMRLQCTQDAAAGGYLAVEASEDFMQKRLARISEE